MLKKDTNGIDWDAIRAEYITDVISQRALAEKYGLKYSAVRRQAERGGWLKARQEAEKEAIEKAKKAAVAAASNNAATAQRIRGKLLARLEKEIDALPDKIGTTAFSQTTGAAIDDKGRKIKKNSGLEYKLRDLTAAWRDLTGDMQPETGGGNELLQSLYDLEVKARGD